jgi:hypothetical protein
MWGGWYGLLSNIIFSGLCFGLLENGQIGASEKTDNDVLLAQTKGPFILKVDGLSKSKAQNTKVMRIIPSYLMQKRPLFLHLL